MKPKTNESKSARQGCGCLRLTCYTSEKGLLGDDSYPPKCPAHRSFVLKQETVASTAMATSACPSAGIPLLFRAFWGQPQVPSLTSLALSFVHALLFVY